MATQLTVAQAIGEIGMGRFQYRVMAMAGLFWAADAIEIMLLSLIGIRRQNGNINKHVTKAVFCGSS